MKKIFISKYADNLLKDFLTGQGYFIEEISALADIDEAISCHPDIYMCDLGNTLFKGDPAKLAYDYPGHAIYNGCSTGKYFIHNSKITDQALKDAAAESGLIPVNVAQGYSKCNCVVVDEDSIITSDAGIEKACTAAGLNVLMVSRGQVVLEGYPYGFLGGASGKVENTIIFNGNLAAHSDYNAIKTFIESRGLEVIYFDSYPLTDIGSIIEEK